MPVSLLKHATGSVAFLSLVVWLGGCAQPPVERLEQAQRLIDAARVAGAPDYTTEEWARLEAAFELAKEEMANQEKVIAVFRSYAKADDMLKRVAQDAARVGALAAEKRAELQVAAETAEREARNTLASAEEMLLRVPTGRTRAAMKRVGHELTALKDSLGSVHRLIEEGRFASAQSQARLLKEKAAAAADQLREAAGGRARHGKG